MTTDRVITAEAYGTTAFAGVTKLSYPPAGGTASPIAVGQNDPIFQTFVPYTGATANVQLGDHSLAASHIQLDTTPAAEPTEVGSFFWDAANRTVTINMEDDVHLQVGQEMYVPLCTNKTGFDIPDGKAVYVDGSSGNRPSIALADRSSYETSRVIGITTQAIPNNMEGLVTVFGSVSGFDTSGFSETDILYLDSTPGEITNVEPTSPDLLVAVAIPINSTVSGKIFVNPRIPIATNIDLDDDLNSTPASQKAVKDHIDVRLQFLTDCLNPTGFVNPTGIDVAYSVTNRTITLTGDLSYYWRGVKYELTSPWTSDAHDSADGRYFLYTTDGTTFAWSTTVWDLSYIQVGIGLKKTSPAYAFGLRETHGTMDIQSHIENHDRTGTYVVSGGTLTAGTYAENTATDDANSPGFEAAVIKDEDCLTAIPAWTQGTYTTMRIGASGVTTFDTTATLPFRSAGSFILYNTPSTGAETAAGNNQYLNVYQVLIPVTSDAESQAYRMVMLQPQAAYGSLAAAQAEDPRGLSLGDFTSLAPEYVLHARITYVTLAGDLNTGKCRIATGGVSYLTGSRSSQVAVTGYIPSSHQNLTDLEITTSGHIMNTGKVLGRTTASSGSVEEIGTTAGVSMLTAADSDAQWDLIKTSALGETSDDAYRGDRGKTAYDHSQETSGTPHGGAYAVPNADTSGSAGSLKSPSTTGLLQAVGMTDGVTRVKTFRDADDTVLELGGSYTPTGAWDWATSASITMFKSSTTGSVTSGTFYLSENVLTTAPSSASSANFQAGRFVNSSSGTSNIGTMTGTTEVVSHVGSGLVTNVIGDNAFVSITGGNATFVYSQLGAVSMTGTTTIAIGLLANLRGDTSLNNPNATITTFNGMMTQNTTTSAASIATLRNISLGALSVTGVASTTTVVSIASGAINAASVSPAANAYQMLTGNVTGAVNNYQLYLGTGVSYFSDATEATSASNSSIGTLGGIYATKNIVSAASVRGSHVSSDGTSGMTGVITFYGASSSGGSVNVLNTVTIKDGLITSWTQA